MSRSGTARLEAARNFLRAELAHADPATADRAVTEAADALLAIARRLNRSGVRDDAA
jgi:flagellar motor switch protein FliG